MKKLTLTLLILFISCQSDNKNEFKNKVISEIKKTDIPAVVMGKIYKSGKMDFYSYGSSRWGRTDLINEKNIFRIASMTKALSSVAALQLVERGKITLDESLDEYLPEMSKIPILNENNDVVNPENSITLRHLLTHTSGFGTWFTSSKLKNWDSLKNTISWKVKGEPRLFEAGSSFMYGKSTYWIGKLIEKISEMSLEDYFREHITGPLQMNSTWFNVPDDQENLVSSSFKRNKKTNKLTPKKYAKKKRTKSYNAAAGLSSSPEDYGKFISCMLNGGSINNLRILKRETFELLNEPQLKSFRQIHRYVPDANVDVDPRGDKDFFFDNFDNWTLAWGYEENSIVRPIGTAYWAGFNNTYFTIDFENEFGLVYMTQITPFNDMSSFNLFTSFERLIYDEIKNNKESTW